MNLESAYEAKKYEDQIYQKWENSNAFYAKVDNSKEAFSIAMPPPNATGVLHLGHAVMLALEDLMIRHARMTGKSALWVPGTDHAAIATQSVVEKELQKNGIENPRKTLGRDKLLEEIKKFVELSKGNIKNQIRKIGASCDWSREKYTFDEDMNAAVNHMFGMMYKDELIYRGGRIVNWDPKMQTTVADDEIEYKEENAKFYYFQFGPVVIGTARPETKFKDKIIVVHPDDERYKDLVGKEFTVEWIEGPIQAKVIADPCIDMNLGTGAMTITPAHSALDFELAQKYSLEVEQIIDFNGIIKNEVSEQFGGLDIKQARNKIIETLDQKGLLVKVEENYQHNIAVNYRGKGVIEPQVMKQWFVDVNKKAIDWKGQKMSIKEVLQDVINSGMIEIVPKKFNKTYFHWIDNLKDWCISRQIWWGHQIPVWYQATAEQFDSFYKMDNASSLALEILDIKGDCVFSETKPAGDNWIRDPDTLDTWFSSALWPFATLGWPNKTDEIKYFFPTSVLETGYDILFFWVARMILASTYALRGSGSSEENSIPFKKVYLHGLIRDRYGKKMSKSNPETCIDPLDMIEKYGADALRLSLVIGSTPGNDMNLYEEKIAGYRNFINKIWNASRFALMNVDTADLETKFEPGMVKSFADKWILTKLQNLISEVDKNLKSSRYSDCGNQIYEFFWKDLCDWYLEVTKGEHKNPAVLMFVLRSCLKLLHPFIPFVTEKLWEFTNPGGLLINEVWPQVNKDLIFTDETLAMEDVHNVISEIRKVRSELKVDPAKKIQAVLYAHDHQEILEEKREAIMRLARLESLIIQKDGEKIPDAKVSLVQGIEIFLPLDKMINMDQEAARLGKEIAKKKLIIESLEAKLANEKFVANAPAEVVNMEREKLHKEKEHLDKMTNQLLSISKK